MARYRTELAGLVTLLGLIFFGRQQLQSWSLAKARVPELVKLTLDRLATQAAYHAQDPMGVPEPGILAAQLRDDVLRDEFSPRRREGLWIRVAHVVEMNANVRTSRKEMRTGEVGRVWEWIGSVGAIEDAYTTGGGESGMGLSSRRQSGRMRMSFGFGGGNGSSPAPSSPSPAVGLDGGGTGRKEMLQRREGVWEESRPIY